MMQVYVYTDKIYFCCKAKDLCKLIREYALEYSTVQEMINAMVPST